MRTRVKAACAVLFLAVAWSSHASAQRYVFDGGGSLGGTFFSRSLTSEMTGGAGDVRLSGRAPAGAAQLSWWGFPFDRIGGVRLGLRASGGYTPATLEQDAGALERGTIDLWTATGELVFGFRQPRPTWSGAEVLPWMTVGGGVRWVNPANTRALLVNRETRTTWSGFPFVCATNRCVTADDPADAMPGQRTYFFARELQSVGTVSLGSDVRVKQQLVLRIEFGDRLWKAPIRAADPPDAAFPEVLATTHEQHSGRLVHELYGQAGIAIPMGLRPERRMTVALPAPPIQPLPPPPPPPALHTVQLCVIDPAAETGTRTLLGTYTAESRDTTVQLGPLPAPLRAVMAHVKVALDARWFIQGQPLDLPFGEPSKYVTDGWGQAMDPDKLVYLGTSSGLTLFAHRYEAGALDYELRHQRWLAGTTELSIVLNGRDDLRLLLRSLPIVYVPLTAVGCEFQALRRLEEIRKR
jgi:hypothetical protein